ncbi:MAG: hypothetical protein ACFFCM_14795 [Promethearchaeota archaeon]
MHSEINGHLVYLKDDKKILASINYVLMKVKPNHILTALNVIGQKYDFSLSDIQRINKSMVSEEKIRDWIKSQFIEYKNVENITNKIDLTGTLIGFCYWCHILDNNNVDGIQNLINKVKKHDQIGNVLHDLFVAQVSAYYVLSNAKVEILVRKTEVGTDLKINNVNSEIKIGLGYLSHNLTEIFDSIINKTTPFKSFEKILIDTYNKIEDSYQRKKAKVIFFDYSRLASWFTINHPYFKKREVPIIKYEMFQKDELMVIIYNRGYEEDFWVPLFFKNLNELENSFLNLSHEK